MILQREALAGGDAPELLLAAALASRDDNGDGVPQASEIIETVPLDPSVTLTWGVAAAVSVGVGGTSSSSSLPTA